MRELELTSLLLFILLKPLRGLLKIVLLWVAESLSLVVPLMRLSQKRHTLAKERTLLDFAQMQQRRRRLLFLLYFLLLDLLLAVFAEIWAFRCCFSGQNLFPPLHLQESASFVQRLLRSLDWYWVRREIEYWGVYRRTPALWIRPIKVARIVIKGLIWRQLKLNLLV